MCSPLILFPSINHSFVQHCVRFHSYTHKCICHDIISCMQCIPLHYHYLLIISDWISLSPPTHVLHHTIISLSLYALTLALTHHDQQSRVIRVQPLNGIDVTTSIIIACYMSSILSYYHLSIHHPHATVHPSLPVLSIPYQPIVTIQCLPLPISFRSYHLKSPVLSSIAHRLPLWSVIFDLAFVLNHIPYYIYRVSCGLSALPSFATHINREHADAIDRAQAVTSRSVGRLQLNEQS